MELSHQFQLFEPPEGAPQLTEWPDVSKVASRPSPTPRPRSRQGIEIEHVGTVYPFLHRNDDVQHEPLAMFHSAREITEKWAPAEGDRLYHGTDTLVHGNVHPVGRWDPRAGERTERPETTDQRHNERWGDPDTGEIYHRRTAERIRTPAETDEQFWERKGTEAHETDEERAQRVERVHIDSGLVDPADVRSGRFRAKRYPERTQSLAEHIQSGGEIPPIPLGHHKAFGDRPLVAGGGHRIGAMLHINPDQLLPVEHWSHIVEAKRSKGYT